MGNQSSSNNDGFGSGYICSSSTNQSKKKLRKTALKSKSAKDIYKGNNSSHTNNASAVDDTIDSIIHQRREQYLGKLGIDNSHKPRNSNRQTIENYEAFQRNNSIKSKGVLNSNLIMSKMSVGASLQDSGNYLMMENSQTQLIDSTQMQDSRIKLMDDSLYMDKVFARKQSDKDESTTNLERTVSQTQVSTSADGNSAKKKVQFGPGRLRRSQSQSSFIYKEDEDTKQELLDEEPEFIEETQVIENVDLIEKYSVINKDKSYMLSYIVNHKESEQGKLLIKSTDKIRTNFLSKLAYQKLWISPHQKARTHQTCIIFDWDDTILCTSFLAPYPSLLQDFNKKIPSDMQEALFQLDVAAQILLSMAKQLGMLFIITNAAEGWVEMSSQRFLPLVHQELMNDVTIISARTRYEKQFPHDYQEWKIRAFLEAQSALESDAITNLVAIGDNNIEIEAAYHLAQQFQQAFIKTIKFRESPSTQELTKQIKLVTNQFQQIVIAPKNLTVRLQKFGKHSAVQKEEEKESDRVVRQRKLFLERQKYLLTKSEIESEVNVEPLLTKNNRSSKFNSFFDQDSKIKRRLTTDKAIYTFKQD